MNLFVFPIIIGLYFHLSTNLDHKDNTLNIDLATWKKPLYFDSDFGLLKSQVTPIINGFEFINKSEDFYYSQLLLEKNDSIYVTEVEQEIEIFLFISKSNTVKYDKPLLRYPVKLTADSEWMWKGTEYYGGGDSSRINVDCRVAGIENLNTPLGNLRTFVVESRIQNETGTDNLIREWISEEYGMVKSEIFINGGGFMGMMRDIFGYGEISFILKDIEK